ncbi:R-spondin-4 isoform X2 [Pongo abelii]|uniref:R-spondin-4 isoform X2 n=2 Tax=Pongo TaxID=9599 RepID=UPI0023E8F958|nr:R-spondin-4 isoform X2 [Pongo abelii]
MRPARPQQPLCPPCRRRAVGPSGCLGSASPDQAAQMRAPLCLLLLVAHAVDTLALNRRKKQVGTGLGGNCTGCIICSEENGCSTCQQRLFLFIHREGIRQYGKCLHDCPPGYFGIRGQEVNRCKKCGATCESCFSQDFCIRCKRQFYLYKGKCLPTCPPGTLAHQNTRECQERNPGQKKGRKDRRPRKDRKLDMRPRQPGLQP